MELPACLPDTMSPGRLSLSSLTHWGNTTHTPVESQSAWLTPTRQLENSGKCVSLRSPQIAGDANLTGGVRRKMYTVKNISCENSNLVGYLGGVPTKGAFVTNVQYLMDKIYK